MKKSILILSVLLFGVFSLHSQSTDEHYTLQMSISDLGPIEGKVGIRLLDTQEKVVKQQWLMVEEETMQAVFIEVPSGTYAVQYYHDANDNDQLDFTWYGPPSEGYGNSNDVRGLFGPPDFKEQLFELSSDMSIEMKTKN